MQQISFTELRTRSKRLAEALSKGKEVNLIRKSQVIGKIIPSVANEYKVINASQLEDKVQKLSLPKLTLREMKKRYRAAMMKKHGKGISRH